MDVVCIPGVGLGGWAFDGVLAALPDGTPARVLERPWSGAAQSVEAQADAIAATIRATTDAALILGVSGGATVGLALCVRHPDLVRAAVLHEPLIGPASPRLHSAITTRAAQLTGTDDAAVEEFLVALIGADTWDALPAGRRDAIDRDRVRSEVPAFARFVLSDDDAAKLRGRRITTTVGDRSGLERHDVATWLAEHAGVAVEVIDGAGNSAHLDAATALAAVAVCQFSDR